MSSDLSLSLSLSLQQLEALARQPGDVEALSQLTPGTDSHTYYLCIALEVRGELDECARVLERWRKRGGDRAAQARVEARLMLRRWPQHKTACLAKLQRELGLRIDHQRPRGEGEARAPMDPAASRLAAETVDFIRHARDLLARDRKQLRGFTRTAHPWLVQQATTSEPSIELEPAQRASLLSALSDPAYPGVLDFVVAQLQAPKAKAFGSVGIHNKLALEQLVELLERVPELASSEKYLAARLAHLRPDGAVAWAELDADARAHALERLWAYVRDLDSKFNSVTALVAYHRLCEFRRRGEYPRGAFSAYLALPRSFDYVAPQVGPGGARVKGHTAVLDHAQTRATGLPPVHDDEALVRDYIEHFLALDPDISEFSAFVDDAWLRSRLVTARITRTEDGVEAWAELLADSNELQTIINAVQLDFPHDHRRSFALDEAVEIDVVVQNVPELWIKVYEIDAGQWYRAHTRPLDVDIDLHGLRPHHEERHEFTQPAHRRHRESFELPSMASEGVYVVDFVGGGLSSRALVQKGVLRARWSHSCTGQVITVLDAELRPAAGARVTIAEQSLEVDESGRAIFPYLSDAQARQSSAVVTRGALATQLKLPRSAIDLQLDLNGHAGEEGMGMGQPTLLICPQLRSHGQLVELEGTLEELSLRAEIHGCDGTRSELALEFDSATWGRYSGHTLPLQAVPESVSVLMTAKIQLPGRPQPVELSARTQLWSAPRPAVEHIEQLQLELDGEDYELRVLGRNGEPGQLRGVTLRLRHLYFSEPMVVVCSSDLDGRIELGRLLEFRELHAELEGGGQGRWKLHEQGAKGVSTLEVALGEEVELPAFMSSLPGDVSPCTYVERSNDRPCRVLAAPPLDGSGRLLLKTLQVGEYKLAWVADELPEICIRVHPPGPDPQRFSTARATVLRTPAQRLAIVRTEIVEGQLRLQLRGACAQTRVHICAHRFVPRRHMGRSWAAQAEPAPAWPHLRRSRIDCVAQRRMGDEMRYVLERRHRKAFVGNMLPAPGLLLNPRELRESSNEAEKLRAPEGFAGAPAPEPRHAMAAMSHYGASPELPKESPGSAEYLLEPPMTWTNLEVDAEGGLQLDLATVAHCSHMQIVVSAAHDTLWTELGLPRSEMQTRDLRLAEALPCDEVYDARNLVTRLVGDECVELESRGECRVHTGLRDLYDLLRVRCDDPRLAEFEFLVEWPELDDSRQSALYSKYVCHELNLFLQRKDPEFFTRVVATHTRHKIQRDFIDDYLLSADLSVYLEPWAYARLNLLERILLGQHYDDDEVARALRGQLDRHPPDADEVELGFNSALAQRELSFAPSDGMEVTGAGLDASVASVAVARPADQSEDEVASAPAQSRKSRVSREQSPAPIAPPAYTSLEGTREYREAHFFARERGACSTLFAANAFWLDFAESRGGKFISTHVADCEHHLNEALCILALTDLPWKGASVAEESTQAGRPRLRAGGDCLVYHRVLERSDAADVESDAVLVGRVLLLGDAPSAIAGSSAARARGKLSPGRRYLCRVNLTNTGHERHRVRVFVEIPQGAIALDRRAEQRTHNVELAAQSAHAIEYSFYFPESGRSPHHPVRVFEGKTLIASTEPGIIEVSDDPAPVDSDSWPDLARRGQLDDLCAYLETADLAALDLEAAAWRMHDREAFVRVTDLLAARHHYSAAIWAYALQHGLEARLRELLMAEYARLSSLGPVFSSALIDVHPRGLEPFEFAEFRPLVHARTHMLRSESEVLNPRLRRHYREFLDTVVHAGRSSCCDLLCWSAYAFVLGRIELALELFDAIESPEVRATIQYAELCVHVALYREQLDEARAVAEQYADYPVQHWRERFTRALEQLDEIAGGDAKLARTDDRAARLQQQAESEVNLSLECGCKKLKISARNVARVQLEIFPFDAELLFSRAPFAESNAGDATILRPATSLDVELDPQGHAERALPRVYRHSNVIVRVRAGGTQETQTMFNHALNVEYHRARGLLQVRDKTSARVVPRAYVKVFARLADGSSVFHKDGYTDLRGRFDYASVSTPTKSAPERLAILVLDRELGARVHEVAAPGRG